MAIAPTPSAVTISIKQALDLLDTDFAELAEGVSKGQYAFWLGSGISRDCVDDLKQVIARVLTHLRDRRNPADPNCTYHRALDEALRYAQLTPADRAAIDLTRPINEWTTIDTILRNLTGAYARLLDIRLDGHPEEDHLLWNVVDVPTTFAHGRATPDCEHLCLAILILEGVLPDIATANWDGLIEAAVGEATDFTGAAVHVCVSADDFRGQPLLTRLLKFHGCAVRAAQDPVKYRTLLIARLSQITAWPHNPDYALMKNALQSLAATKPTLMIGLSAQDSNIQDVFAAGQALMRWNWPCSPPAHVFAEDSLGIDQLNILRFVYQAAYQANRAAIEKSALFRAFAKPALTALVLHILCAKLRTFARTVTAPGLSAADHSTIERGIIRLRDRLAAAADGDRLTFIRTIIAASAKAMTMFQSGAVPDPTSRAYRPISARPNHMTPTDPSLSTSGVREMACAVALLGLGDNAGHWTVEAGNPAIANDGALKIVTAIGTTKVFFAANERAGVQLEINGIVRTHNSDALIIHSTAPVPTMTRSPRAAPGRTGRAGLRQIGMAGLLQSVPDASELQKQFREEASL